MCPLPNTVFESLNGIVGHIRETREWNLRNVGKKCVCLHLPPPFSVSFEASTTKGQEYFVWFEYILRENCKQDELTKLGKMTRKTTTTTTVQPNTTTTTNKTHDIFDREITAWSIIMTKTLNK